MRSVDSRGDRSPCASISDSDRESARREECTDKYSRLLAAVFI